MATRGMAYSSINGVARERDRIGLFQNFTPLRRCRRGGVAWALREWVGPSDRPAGGEQPDRVAMGLPEQHPLLAASNTSQEFQHLVAAEDCRDPLRLAAVGQPLDKILAAQCGRIQET